LQGLVKFYLDAAINDSCEGQALSALLIRFDMEDFGLMWVAVND